MGKSFLSFSGPGRGVQAVVRMGAVLKPDPIPAEIGHIAIDIRQCDGFYQCKVNVHDIDLVKWQALQRGIAELLDVPQKVAKVQIVFINGFL